MQRSARLLSRLLARSSASGPASVHSLLLHRASVPTGGGTAACPQRALPLIPAALCDPRSPFFQVQALHMYPIVVDSCLQAILEQTDFAPSLRRVRETEQFAHMHTAPIRRGDLPAFGETQNLIVRLHGFADFSGVFIGCTPCRRGGRQGSKQTHNDMFLTESQSAFFC